jgi:hypothetical protein
MNALADAINMKIDSAAATAGIISITSKVVTAFANGGVVMGRNGRQDVDAASAVARQNAQGSGLRRR